MFLKQFHGKMPSLLITLMFFLSVTPVFADQASTLLQNKLNAIRTMTASFSQTTQAKNKRTLHGIGSMALSKPGHLLWKMQSPHAQTVLADGQRVWVYDVSLEQVTVKRQRPGMGGVAGLFLTGYQRSVAQYFQVTAQEKGQVTDFELRAKSNKVGISHVHFKFNGQQLVFLQLSDQLGQTTSINFKHIHMNTIIPPQVFQFKAPAGVDVIQQ